MMIFRPVRSDDVEEPAKVARHVINVCRQRRPTLHLEAQDGRYSPNDEHRRHAERVRSLQVVRHILEHGGARAIDAV